MSATGGLLKTSISKPVSHISQAQVFLGQEGETPE